MARVVVVGGGVAGLAAAHWASREGHTVTVLEASPHWGGKAQTLRVDGHRLETALEGFGSEPPALRELCAELGIPLVPKPQPERYVVQGGQHWRLPNELELSNGAGLHQLSQLPLGMGNRWKLGTERFAGASNIAEESLESFLSRRLGQRLWRIMEPLASAQWGGPAAELVASAAYPGLVALERSGGLVAGSRKVQPLPRLVPEGGMGQLVQALGQHLLHSGVKLYARQEAIALARQDHTWKVQTPTHLHEAEAVLLAIPAPQAARLFRRTAPAFTTLINHLPHTHHARVWQGFRVGGQPQPVGEWLLATGEGFNGYRIVVQEPLEGVQTVSVEFQGALAQQADNTLSRMATDDLARLWGQAQTPTAAWVFRHPSSRPQWVAQYSQRLHDLEQTLTHAPGLFLTGSYLAGPDLAQTLAHTRATTGRALDFLLLAPATVA